MGRRLSDCMSGQPSDSKVRSGRAVRNAGNAPAVAGHNCVRRYSLRKCKLHVCYKRRVRSIAGGRCWFQSGSFGGLLCRDEPPYRRVVCRWIHQRRRGGSQSGCLLAQQAPQPRSQIEVKCHIVLVGRMNENSAVGFGDGIEFAIRSAAPRRISACPVSKCRLH
jgi:hypothetical protein